MFIAAYIRVSTTEQGESGLGLDVQRRAISAAAAQAYPSASVRFFEDIQSGAKTNNRAAFNQMVDALDSIVAIFVHRLDRLARNALDLLTLLEKLRVAGVAFHSIKESIDTSTPVGRLFTTVLAAMAEFERDLHRQRTKDALAVKIANGEHVGRPPLGFKANPFRIDPTSMHTVMAIYALRRENHSLRWISRRLSLPLSTVRSVLGNPIYRKRNLV